ncbi:MAG: LysR family transcriptional regulator [Myxococcaceae bacterium]|nr:LysR family transcriptional regulator [Myxococcaceae bacterium]
MPRRARDFDVRLSDVNVFLAVRSHGSVTAAARLLDSSPSHVSKAIDRLERQLATKLLTRTGRGVTLTPAALKLAPLLTDAADALRKARKRGDEPRDVTVAAPSYLLNAYVPLLAEAMAAMRLRALQLSPPAIAASMGSGEFEVAFSPGSPRLPPAWSSSIVGELGIGLFAQPALAKKLQKPTEEALRKQPFITPVQYKNGKWEPVDDGCPLPVGERLAGHEAPAIGLALEIAAHTPQLAFGPRIAARSFLQQKRLAEIHVPGWRVASPLYLAVDIDRITARERGTLIEIATKLSG